MGRDIEICVIDSVRGLGNGHCLPVGPLREAPSRLQTVDFIIQNGSSQHTNDASQWSKVTNQGQQLTPCFTMQLKPIEWQNVKTQKSVSFERLKQLISENDYQLKAFAGIGNPQRFFDSLKQLGFRAQTKSYADHYQYSAEDFSQEADNSLLCMTEKDAVKCENYVPAQSYYLKIAAQLEPEFVEQLCNRLEKVALEKAHLISQSN